MLQTETIDLKIVRPPLPRGCFDADPQMRLATYREYELCMWTDAVEYRGLKLSSLDVLDALSVSGEVRRRNENR